MSEDWLFFPLQGAEIPQKVVIFWGEIMHSLILRNISEYCSFGAAGVLEMTTEQ